MSNHQIVKRAQGGDVRPTLPNVTLHQQVHHHHHYEPSRQRERVQLTGLYESTAALLILLGALGIGGFIFLGLLAINDRFYYQSLQQYQRIYDVGSPLAPRGM